MVLLNCCGSALPRQLLVMGAFLWYDNTNKSKRNGNMELGKEIRRLRTDRGLTQEALTKLYNNQASSTACWQWNMARRRWRGPGEIQMPSANGPMPGAATFPTGMCATTTH